MDEERCCYLQIECGRAKKRQNIGLWQAAKCPNPNEDYANGNLTWRPNGISGLVYRDLKLSIYLHIYNITCNFQYGTLRKTSCCWWDEKNLNINIDTYKNTNLLSCKNASFRGSRDELLIFRVEWIIRMMPSHKLWMAWAACSMFLLFYLFFFQSSVTLVSTFPISQQFFLFFWVQRKHLAGLHTGQSIHCF